MSDNTLIEKLLKLPEFEITDFKQNEHDMGFYVQKRERPIVCPACGSYYPELVIYKTRKQTIRDLNIQDQRVGLILSRHYYQCRECGGRFAEPISCVDGSGRITNRLRQYLADRAKTESFTNIENELQISRPTIRKAFLEEIKKLPTVSTMATPSVLGIDEICLMKDDYSRKQPWAVIANGDDHTVMELLRNRSKPTIIALLQSLKDPQKVKVVTMDMWAGYRNVVYEVLPNALVVIDKFHIVKMATEQMDSIRRRYSRTAPSQLKRNKAVFLMREDKLSPKSIEVRDAWFAEYPVLAQTYRLKESFFNMYSCPTRESAEAYFLDWQKSIPKETDYNGFRLLARTVHRCQKEVFNYFDVPETNAFVEGLNNVIRAISTQGKGYDFDVLRGKVLFTAGRKIVRPRIDFSTISLATPDSWRSKPNLPPQYGLPEDHGIPFSAVMDAVKNGCYL